MRIYGSTVCIWSEKLYDPKLTLKQVCNVLVTSNRLNEFYSIIVFTVKTNTIQVEGNNDIAYAGIALLTIGVILSVVISLAFLVRKYCWITWKILSDHFSILFVVTWIIL